MRYGISAAARFVRKSESTVRNAEKAGVITAERDSAGRRLFTEDQLETLRKHLDRKRAA